METQELLLTALRAAAVYVLMLVVIRLMGKRTVGNFTAFDLLVADALLEGKPTVVVQDGLFIVMEKFLALREIVRRAGVDFVNLCAAEPLRC
jgi:uncharacterized membrane protein YcaP (DUF421 family)